MSLGLPMNFCKFLQNTRQLFSGTFKDILVAVGKGEWHKFAIFFKYVQSSNTF